MNRYFIYKKYNYQQEILQKTILKTFLGSTRVWTRDLQIVGPACYKRATQICYCREGFFMVHKNVPCAQKIFVLLTSQSWKPEIEYPEFPCGNLIFSKDGQKWPSKTIFSSLLYLKQCLQHHPKLINANLQSSSIFPILVS